MAKAGTNNPDLSTCFGRRVTFNLTIDIYKEIDLYKIFSVYYRERLIKWIRRQLQKGQSV